MDTVKIMSRQKNSIYNLVWGIVGNIITSIVAIIIPRLFIVNYGSEINGLLASIRQIYVYLTLLEVGVGDASIVALYGPIAKSDHQSVNKILAATDHYYKRIGGIYAISIIILGVVYPLFLNTTVPYPICFGVIVLQGSGSVISYLVQGKYNMLLRVDNRSYVTSNVGTITSVLTDGSRIYLLLHGKSIIAVQTTYFIFNLLKMIYIGWYIKKNYPWLDLHVKPDFQAVSQKTAVFIHQISALVFSHTDILILTFVCGLKTVSIYSLYATIYGMIDNIVTITSNSVQAAMGQIFHSDKKKYLDLQESFETYYLALVFSLFAIATIFVIPFMRLYTVGADINYIDRKLPILFVTYKLLNYGRITSNNIIGFSGAFKETQWRAWLETIINLVVSFLCVFKLGIYGVLLGTIVALLYRANDIIIFANCRLLKRSAWGTYRRWITNIIVFCLIVMIGVDIPLQMDTYLSLILNALWVSILVTIVFFGVSSLIEVKARKIAQTYLKNIVSKMLKFRSDNR